MQTRFVVGGAGLLAVLGIALLLGRCGGSSEPAREPRAENEPAAAERQAGATEPSNAASAALTAETSVNEPKPPATAPDGSAPAPNATGTAAPPSSAATRINSALARDPRDLALFARIERELKRSPPPAVSTIVEARANGATREELLAHARRLLADDFQVRTLVIRWIDEVAPAPGGAKTAPATPGSSPSGPSLVQPIRTK